MRPLSVTGWVVLFLSLGPAASAGSLSGHVVDPQGKPVAGARVFAEPGLAGALIETAADAQGAWRLDNLPAASPLGVFALADGFAFGGVSINAASDATADIAIQLGTPSSLSGRVVNSKKDPVAGARITRVGLVGTAKVGIPTAKLKPFGIAEPVTDADGRFSIDRLPAGTPLAIKVAHADYAQEAADGISAGGTDVKVTLNPGVLLEGDVLARDSKAAVGDASVIIRNTQPPYDTAVTRSNSMGHFALRLKPGVYVYQASTASLQSPGWQRLTLTGQEPEAHSAIYMARVGRIRGKVCDAVSSKPVAGAKLSLESQGNAASVTLTGADGTFSIQAVEGESILRLDSAPGYRPPEQPSLKIQIVAEKELALPEFWVAPLPTYTVEVVDANLKPVPGAIVSVLRPLQFGWRETDAQGRVTIQFTSLPSDGIVVGMVEHAAQPLGAVFALKQENANPARVELFPLGTVHGRVVAANAKPVPGCVVAGLLGDGGLPLWRTVSDGKGAFAWNGVVSKLPQRVIAGEEQPAPGAGVPVTIETSESKDVGDVAGPEGLVRTSLLGAPLAWYDNHLVSGTLPDRKTRRTQPMVVVYCSAADAPIAIESFTVAYRLFASRGVGFAVVVDGTPPDSANAPFPILSGRPAGTATTYLTGGEGTVVLETFGMPPLRALQDLVR